MDNCRICTEGLRALVALLDSVDGSGPERKLREEEELVAERLEAAFGQPVPVAGFGLLKMVDLEQ